MFCPNCGAQLLDGARFCSKCGRQPYQQGYQPNQGYQAAPFNPVTSPYAQRQYDPNWAYSLVKQLSHRELAAGIIWSFVALIQILLGIFVIWVFLIPAVWNIICAILRFVQSSKVLTPYQSLVGDYQKWLPQIIVLLVVNAVIGGIIGAAGAIYDLSTRSFVLANSQGFESFASQSYARYGNTYY
jgi:hypothetical protein